MRRAVRVWQGSFAAAWCAAGALAAAQPPADFDRCLAGLRGEALARGISGETFDRALAGVEFDPSVIEASRSQPEFRLAIWDYLAGLVDDERVADGRARLEEWREVLARAEQRFGVDRHVLVAIWGVESDYGRILGRRPLLRSLATLACAGTRQAFGRGELLATLRIVQSGDIGLDSLVGSWAGAFGQTQFIPSTYQRLAIDFDGDGRRDIVASVPDALGSTANYLRRAGWRSGEAWGYEVRLPPGWRGPSGRTHRQPLAEWQRLGVRPLAAAPAPASGPAALLLPAGPQGPAFLVFRNFDAIYAYNHAESYALAIALLADRLRGAPGVRTPWPTEDPGLSRAERRELQRLLNERGAGLGEPDGIIGARSMQAIRAFQQSAGLPVDGRAGQRLLRVLRDAPR
jgi:lytic murein transglycosylase